MRIQAPIARLVVCCIVLGLSAVSCSGTHFTIPNEPAREYDTSRGRTIRSETSGFQLLLFIPISINDRHERAWRELQRRANGDFITDVKIKDSWTWALVGTVYQVDMEATAYPYM
jgi:hypothetical protein